MIEIFLIRHGFGSLLESVSLCSDSDSERHNLLSKEGDVASLHRHSIWLIRIVSLDGSSGLADALATFLMADRTIAYLVIVYALIRLWKANSGKLNR